MVPRLAASLYRPGRRGHPLGREPRHAPAPVRSRSPGHRPRIWWQFDAPQRLVRAGGRARRLIVRCHMPRERLGGVGAAAPERARRRRTIWVLTGMTPQGLGVRRSRSFCPAPSTLSLTVSSTSPTDGSAAAGDCFGLAARARQPLSEPASQTYEPYAAERLPAGRRMRRRDRLRLGRPALAQVDAEQGKDGHG